MQVYGDKSKTQLKPLIEWTLLMGLANLMVEISREVNAGFVFCKISISHSISIYGCESEELVSSELMLVNDIKIELL